LSTPEQAEGYSVDAQRRAFQVLVQGRDWVAIREYLEEGRSARTEDISRRPVFKEMIADALAGKFESENSTPLGVGCAIRPVAVCYIEGQRRA